MDSRAMSPEESGGLPGVVQVLFIQGGGVGTYDDWDHKLVVSLQRGLDAEHAVRYPRMPDEDDPSWAAWGPTIRAQLEELDRDAVVVGHSVGGTLLVHALASERQRRRLGGIVLIGAPFVGAGGWPGDEFELTTSLGESMPDDAVVLVVHGDPARRIGDVSDQLACEVVVMIGHRGDRHADKTEAVHESDRQNLSVPTPDSQTLGQCLRAEAPVKAEVAGVQLHRRGVLLPAKTVDRTLTIRVP